MADQLTCQTAEFFMLRAPSLPLDSFLPEHLSLWGSSDPGPTAEDLDADREMSRSMLRNWIQGADVREAITLASNDLSVRIDLWLEDCLKAKEAHHLERSLLKYFLRMTNRSTPYGLFASVSIGTWGHESQLLLGPWHESRKVVRLDWGVLGDLLDHIEHEPEIRMSLKHHPNSSLYARGDWYRYLEPREEIGRGRTYHLEAVEASIHLEYVLRQAADGVALGKIASNLADQQSVELVEAKAFVDQVADVHLLTADIRPPVTSSDPLGHVIGTLQAIPGSGRIVKSLGELELELQAIQNAPFGSYAGGFQFLSEILEGLGVSPNTRNLVQVDLFRPAQDLALSPAVRRAFEEGAETLRSLTHPSKDSPLERFRTTYLERYGTRWMPLLEVLDEESGIGFDGVPSPDCPLLVDLSMQPPSNQRSLSQRDMFLITELPRLEKEMNWELNESDWEKLVSPNLQPFPNSFASLTCLEAVSVEALDRGDFQFCMENYSGPTAARWFGRFAAGDQKLKRLLKTHLQEEERMRPDAVFAEVIHVHENRMGNILARPALREFEIPILATSGVPSDRTIHLADLQVAVRGERIVLVSKRLGQEVIPRLSSAHNFTRGAVIYRFLAHLQDQDGRPGGWSWGILAEQPFLPRVTRGRHVLSKARWRIEAHELNKVMANSSRGHWEAFQTLRRIRRLPRFVMLTDGDNSLLVDLDRTLAVETLYHLVSSRDAFTLTECFPDPTQSLITSPEGRFAHELVVPFKTTTVVRPKSIASPEYSTPVSARSFSPGSEWLYLKLYCGPTCADRLLVGMSPILKATKEQGIWSRWHFVRYQDPSYHIRLRFHGNPSRLLFELLPVLREHLERQLVQGMLWKWQVDTFEPEYERYGGDLGFSLAEAWFSEDSDLALDYLVEGASQEDRWRIGLRRTDAIWAALGLSELSRRDLAKSSREAFRKEFVESQSEILQIGVKYRTLRGELESGFPVSVHTEAFEGLQDLLKIREASDRKLLQEDMAAIAGSLSHMHLNRLLRTNHRANEWVIMEFLTRLYESHLAKIKDVSSKILEPLAGR